VLVDFFNIGPAIQSMDIFNKVRNVIGRKNVTTKILDNGLLSRRVNGSDGRTTYLTGAFAIAVVGLIGVF
jgi:hypothetical protein